jgi:SPX domain protein involved in polyphosphate accumulation
MNNRIFNRYERKFLITKDTMNACIAHFKNYLSHDPYSTDGKHYTIYNLYFDTKDYSIIRNSVQKPTYKEKLRLRTYAHPLSDDSDVFLEIKKKHHGRVNKRRVTMTYKQAKDYLSKHLMPDLEGYDSQQVMKEIDYFISLHKAKPGAYIRYDRIALLSEHDDLRITFDFNIVYRTKNLSLENPEGKLILPSENHVLMEIKSDNNFPLWLAKFLSLHKIYSQSFSKYGKAYEDYIGGNTDDDIFYND